MTNKLPHNTPADNRVPGPRSPEHRCLSCGCTDLEKSHYYELAYPAHAPGAPPHVVILCDRADCQSMRRHQDFLGHDPQETDCAAWVRMRQWATANPLQNVSLPRWRAVAHLAQDLRTEDLDPRAALQAVRDALQGDHSAPARAVDKLAGALRASLKSTTTGH